MRRVGQLLCDGLVQTCMFSVVCLLYFFHFWFDVHIALSVVPLQSPIYVCSFVCFEYDVSVFISFIILSFSFRSLWSPHPNTIKMRPTNTVPRTRQPHHSQLATVASRQLQAQRGTVRRSHVVAEKATPGLYRPAATHAAGDFQGRCRPQNDMPPSVRRTNAINTFSIFVDYMYSQVFNRSLVICNEF